jgi:hypothetical protein
VIVPHGWALDPIVLKRRLIGMTSSTTIFNAALVVGARGASASARVARLWQFSISRSALAAFAPQR